MRAYLNMASNAENEIENEEDEFEIINENWSDSESMEKIKVTVDETRNEKIFVNKDQNALNLANDVNNNDKEKLLILLGESGNGKSSFVNYTADVTENVIAKEGNSIYSGGNKEVHIYSFVSKDLGKLIIVDTQGLNDPKEQANLKSIFKIFKALFSQNSTYVVDAIVYFEFAGNPKFQCEKYLRLFCDVFTLDFEEIQKSTIFIHSRYNDLNDRAKNCEHENKMDDIRKKYANLKQIKWDNKYPVDGQLNELKSCLNKTNKFTLNFNAYHNEIREIQNKLREEDKYIKTEKVIKCENMVIKNRKQKITQSENVSSAGLFTVISFGFTKMFSRIFSGRENLNMDLPKYPDNTIYDNKKVTNFVYSILNKKDIVEDEDGNYPISIKLADGNSVMTSFYVDLTLFGKASIEFEVTYDIEYKIKTTENKENIIYRHDLDHYLKKATDDFLHNKQYGLNN